MVDGRRRWMLAVVASFGLAACGRKNDPVLPDADPEPDDEHIDETLFDDEEIADPDGTDATD